MEPELNTAVVIGAGIVGVSICLQLQGAGFKVTLLDRCEPDIGASTGNAGAFAFADVLPLATPGIIRAAPKWLLDPLGPLAIAPSYALSIAPWLLRFWRSSWSDRFPGLLNAQAGLMGLARGALERQAADNQCESLLSRGGQLRLFEGETSFKNSQSYWDACQQFGIQFDLLRSSGAISEVQPGISSRFTHAGYTSDWINTIDPKLWLEHLFSKFMSRGGYFKKERVERLEMHQSLTVIHGEAKPISAHFVIIAAGAWSHFLAQSIGDKIPLETERGYNTTLENIDFQLKTHLTFPEHGFVISKIGELIRVGGAVELAGLVKAPNFKRSKDLLNKAQQFIPELAGCNGAEWMGFRPSMPDSLPVISPSAKSKRVIYAFGHGHLGLTQAAATAELVRLTVEGKQWPISPMPFAADRF